MVGLPHDWCWRYRYDSEAVVARKLETTGHEILKAVHPHPTMSEAVMEAVADAYGEVIHL
jgi:dihydrolipoamide dehydrogenase